MRAPVGSHTYGSHRSSKHVLEELSLGIFPCFGPCEITQIYVIKRKAGGGLSQP